LKNFFKLKLSFCAPFISNISNEKRDYIVGKDEKSYTKKAKENPLSPIIMDKQFLGSKPHRW